MASIIMAAVPIHGHVTPLLAVARHFTGRGDRVRFLTGSRFAEVVEATGAQHVPLPSEADFDDRQDWQQTFPERAGLRGSKAIAFDIEQPADGLARRRARPEQDAPQHHVRILHRARGERAHLLQDLRDLPRLLGCDAAKLVCAHGWMRNIRSALR